MFQNKSFFYAMDNAEVACIIHDCLYTADGQEANNILYWVPGWGFFLVFFYNYH